MPRLSPDAQPLSEWLKHQPQSLDGLLGRARLIANMTQSLRQWSRENWSQHIRVANLRGDVIVIFSSSAAALVPLRAKQQALLDFLNNRFQLACNQLEIKVRP